jgi:hypothetical protein
LTPQNPIILENTTAQGPPVQALVVIAPNQKEYPQKGPQKSTMRRPYKDMLQPSSPSFFPLHQIWELPQNLQDVPSLWNWFMLLDLRLVNAAGNNCWKNSRKRVQAFSLMSARISGPMVNPGV